MNDPPVVIIVILDSHFAASLRMHSVDHRALWATAAAWSKEPQLYPSQQPPESPRIMRLLRLLERRLWAYSPHPAPGGPPLPRRRHAASPGLGPIRARPPPVNRLTATGPRQVE